jgi:hypothetical protein
MWSSSTLDHLSALSCRDFWSITAGVGTFGYLPIVVLLTKQCGSIVTGLGAISILLFFPETQYNRKLITGIESDSASEGGEVAEKGSDAPAVQEQLAPSNKRTFLQELSPWSGINHEQNFWKLLFRPLPMIVYPATIFGFLSYSATLAWFLCILDTNASIFQAPPYNMSPGVNSLINIANIIGVLLGAYAGGGLTDKFCEWRARKNNGVFEPETRLVALILPFFAVPIGLLMYSFHSLPLTNRYSQGVKHLTNWPVPFIGSGFVGFGMAAIPSIGMTYGTSPNLSIKSSHRFVLYRRVW